MMNVRTGGRTLYEDHNQKMHSFFPVHCDGDTCIALHDICGRDRT